MHPNAQPVPRFLRLAVLAPLLAILGGCGGGGERMPAPEVSIPRLVTADQDGFVASVPPPHRGSPIGGRSLGAP